MVNFRAKVKSNTFHVEVGIAITFRATFGKFRLLFNSASGHSGTFLHR